MNSMKSVTSSRIVVLAVLAFGSLSFACGSNPDSGDGTDPNSCAGKPDGTMTNVGNLVICCSGHQHFGTATCGGQCASVGAACSSSTPLCNGNSCCNGVVTSGSCNVSPVNDGGITQVPGPSPTQPVKDGEATWCGNSFRTIRIVWAGIPANGYTARRGAWASPVIKNATGVKTDFRAWPSQKPGEYLDTWLEMDRNVTYATATFEEDAKICSGLSLMVSLYDNHTDGRPAYSPASNCDGTTSFYENGVKLTPRCVANNTADGWNYIVD